MHSIVDRANPKMPLTIEIKGAAKLRNDIIAALVVCVPLVGTIAAIFLALYFGVSAIAIGLFVVGYLLTTLAVTMGFHRYFSHRSFSTSRALGTMFVVLGSMSWQGPLLYWVATHRRHHRFSDQPNDPHSPYALDRGSRLTAKAFWHSHVGWLFSSELSNPICFASDILRNRHVFKMQGLYFLWAALGLVIPTVIMFVLLGTPYAAVEGFLWGGCARVFAVHHSAWSVGSFSHLWGSRPFNTKDKSSNNIVVSVFALGEGLQNNHHAFPRSAFHAFRWFEPDFTGFVLRIAKFTGLIWDLHQPDISEVEALKLKEPEQLLWNAPG
jgi:stearoyl-CoA desaturase (Delta-9 desaturase)